MKEVSQKVFYAAIGPLDVTPRVMGKYGEVDYRSDFVTPRGELKGQCYDGDPDRYFLDDSLTGYACDAATESIPTSANNAR